jgi:hypothetical protein
MKTLLATLVILFSWNIGNAAIEVKEEFCKNEGKGIINEMRIINQQYKLLFGQKNISDIQETGRVIRELKKDLLVSAQLYDLIC